jgi:indolepyruvate ferredoxin oxidoreductase beta subunit
MKKDIILAGVGGQGILSIAFVIDNAAMKQGYFFKQAEVHGMAQRGGAVQSHLRYADREIFSDLVPRGQADMVLSVEPLEALRYLEYLNAGGIVISSSAPFINIPDYPEVDDVLKQIRALDNHILVDSENLAREAGSVRAQNMVMVGAASGHLGLEEAHLLTFVKQLFAAKGDKLMDLNVRAFELGREAAEG